MAIINKDKMTSNDLQILRRQLKLEQQNPPKTGVRSNVLDF